MPSTSSGNNSDLPYWLALVRFQPFGSVRMQKLMRRFQNMKDVFEASASSLLESGIEPQIVSRFLQERIHLNPEQELSKLNDEGVEAITLSDEKYPSLLKTLYDPPAVLFVRGKLPSEEQKHLAVVGSRKASGYGKEATRTIVEPLARAGVVIVSGLAYGIDALAHQAALDVGGTTIAVLGSGVDTQSIYPSSNRSLASQIIAHDGAIISEYPIGTLPLKTFFPIRNRIIAGISHGTLVIEAAIKSGSLITARAALEQGRDVYAVPGPIHSPLSEGPNNLIKMGAIPVTHASDIHSVSTDENVIAYKPVNEDEKVLFDVIEAIPRHADELINLTKLSPSTVNHLLTILEMKGAIRHDGGQYYSRAT
ncbi:DNA-protecting protein DprA [Candidatus Uhrbacteria bacterium]|nr:DNA-protecting protein DprA [Candidatus Uhrbacteria bacterium]